MVNMSDWLNEVTFNEAGLLPAIALDAETKDVLMVACMDQTALLETVEKGVATYWSRSRGKLWRKGESSGHTQEVKEIRIGCDGDVITLLVNQIGGIACHTGRRSCFYRKLDSGTWQEIEPVLKAPEEIYGNE